MGTLEIELYWNHAPKTCANFAELSRRGYYSKTKFHRIIKDFMIQGGDPTATGGNNFTRSFNSILLIILCRCIFALHFVMLTLA